MTGKMSSDIEIFRFPRRDSLSMGEPSGFIDETLFGLDR
jgi:hypothetical protein